MTIWVENPFAGFEVGWTWAQHIAAGYLGGTDYIFYPSDGDIIAAADGKITLQPGGNGFTPGPAVILALGDGRTVNYREVASPLVRSGQTVKRGDSVGVANNASKWPHIDATVNGIRVPFEPLANIGTDPAGGGVTPITEEQMSYAIITLADGPKDMEVLSLDTGVSVPIPAANSARDVGLLQRAQLSGTPTFLQAERDIVKSYLTQLVTPLTPAQVTAIANAVIAGLPAVSGATITQIHTELQSLATTADLPTTEQLGQALTSTVSLVDQHVDSQFSTLTLHT